SCNPNACEAISDACAGNRDEHFAFIPNSDGRWYIGIDDTNPGGGKYVLDAIRPVCGDGVPDHGESCDGQEGCGPDCRWILNSSAVNERLPNDNIIEANTVDLEGA